jgi:hypothetical protein
MNFPIDFAKSDDTDFISKNLYLIWEYCTGSVIAMLLGETFFGEAFLPTGLYTVWGILITFATVYGSRTNAFKKHWSIVVASIAFLFILKMLTSAYHVYSNPRLEYLQQVSLWLGISIWLIMTYKLIRKASSSKLYKNQG